MARHHVIYIPGLADKFNRNFGQGILFGLWRLSGVQPHYFLVRWIDHGETYAHKMSRLMALIDRLHAKGHAISLVSSSAGASLALPAFYRRRDVVQAVVCIAPKLRNPQTVPKTFFTINPAFRQALRELMRACAKLTLAERRKILIIRPIADAVVPIKDMRLRDSHVRVLPVRGHLLCIVMALTWFKKISLRFIRKNS